MLYVVLHTGDVKESYCSIKTNNQDQKKKKKKRKDFSSR